MVIILEHINVSPFRIHASLKETGPVSKTSKCHIQTKCQFRKGKYDAWNNILLKVSAVNTILPSVSSVKSFQGLRETIFASLSQDMIIRLVICSAIPYCYSEYFLSISISNDSKSAKWLQNRDQLGIHWTILHNQYKQKTSQVVLYIRAVVHKCLLLQTSNDLFSLYDIRVSEWSIHAMSIGYRSDCLLCLRILQHHKEIPS